MNKESRSQNSLASSDFIFHSDNNGSFSNEQIQAACLLEMVKFNQILQNHLYEVERKLDALRREVKKNRRWKKRGL